MVVSGVNFPAEWHKIGNNSIKSGQSIQSQNHFYGKLQNGDCSSSAGPETENVERLEALCNHIKISDSNILPICTSYKFEGIQASLR